MSLRLLLTIALREKALSIQLRVLPSSKQSPYSIFKVMYFAQQDQLKEYGLPIMYDTFVARKHGPVPALTYKVLRGIGGKADLSSPELKDFADSLNIAISQDGHQLVLASKNAECDMDELSVADVKMLDKWIEKCKDVESFDLSDKSHEDRAWKRAKRQADKTGEDSKITMYDMAAAAGASKDMLCVIRDRQSVQKAFNFLVVILAVFPDSMKRTLEIEWNYPQVFRLWVVEYYHSL